MGRVEERYALYHGDTFVAEGTAKELAKIEGVTPKTIRFYATPSYYKRKSRKRAMKTNGLVKADLKKINNLAEEYGYSRKELSAVLDMKHNTFNQKMVGIIGFRESELESLEDLFFLDDGELLEKEINDMW